MQVLANLFGLVMCLFALAATIHLARQDKAPLALWVSVILGIVFFVVRSIAEIIELTTGVDVAGSDLGTAASSGWQVLTDLVWFLTVFPFAVALVIAPVFWIFSSDPDTQENRGKYFIGWLFIAGPAVLWNINSEIRHYVFGPLYRFVGMFTS